MEKNCCISVDDLPDAVCQLDPNFVLKNANLQFKDFVSSIAVGLPFLENFIGRDDHERFRSILHTFSQRKQEGTRNGNRHTSVFIRDCSTLTTTSM